jgi:replicative DNA helicase
MQKWKSVQPLFQKNYNDPTVSGKSLPAHIEAERAILNALLLNGSYVAQVAEIISAHDFYVSAHKIIFQMIVDLEQNKKQIDIITVQDELTKKNQLDDIGGLMYLVSLQEDIPTFGLIEQHAHIIKEKAILRELINISSHIISKCYVPQDENVDQLLDEAEKQIFEIANKRISNGFVQLDIWLKKTFKYLTAIKSTTRGVTGISTSYTALDQITSGFQKSDLIVLAARPAMGKTALALNLALSAAKQGFHVGIFSLEMSAEQLTLRLLSAESGIPHYNIKNAAISSDEWITLTSTASALADLKLFIDDSPMLDILSLRTKARKLKAAHKLDLVVIDYLQLLHSTEKHENRHQEVSKISRSAKALAKELEIPIIALSQLSRAVDSRTDKRPMLSDLRESGAIEQDADVIMFLYRDIVYNAETENPKLSELIIGKQRNGPTGTVFLEFQKEITRFENSNYKDDQFLR